jgi:serine O-acetyltransferase
MAHLDTIKKIEDQKRLPHLKYEIREKTTAFTNRLFYTLFDEDTPVEENINGLAEDFERLMKLVCWKPGQPCREIWEKYCTLLPEILEKLSQDARTINENDPASGSIEEVYLAYPGFYAIAIYRLSHELHKFGFPLVPRLMTECAHRLTGVDINPGAIIGVPFFIDHATGVVIGETTIIKNNVKIYQGVTLGPCL